MHFRKRGKVATDCFFTYGNDIVNLCENYKYLGVWFDSFLTYNFHCEALATSGGRALGKILNKLKGYKNVGYNTFSKLYDTGVAPILNYGAGVWGSVKAPCLERVQNRAIRYFVGVHPKSPIPAIQGDMGWFPCNFRRYFDIIRLWNRLISMDNCRLTKQVFLGDYEFHSKQSNQNWCWEVSNLFDSLGIGSYFDNMERVEINFVKPKIIQLINDDWKTRASTKPKLRTYVKLKTCFGAEEYLSGHLSRYKRSLYAQIRFGILPLNIETGRYRGLKEEQRRCIFCADKVENEYHFIMECVMYNDLRKDMLNKLSQDCTFSTNNNEQKFAKLMRLYYKEAAEFVEKAWTIRQRNMFKP